MTFGARKKVVEALTDVLPLPASSDLITDRKP